MLKTLEHLKLILMMQNHQLDIGLVKEYDAERLALCCDALTSLHVPPSSYIGCVEIQKELIGDSQFAGYLEKLSSIIKPQARIDKILKALHENGESALSYPIGRLMSSMVMTASHNEVFLDYLKCFSGLPTDKEQKRVIVSNLAVYRTLKAAPVTDLTSAERALFMEPFLFESELFPYKHANRALTLMASQSEMIDLIRYFFNSRFGGELSIGHYEVFSQSPRLFLNKLREIGKHLSKDNDSLSSLLSRWLENNSPLFDLELLSVKLKDMTEEQVVGAFVSRSSYINLLYGGKIRSIPFSEIRSYQEDVLIHAITSKRNNFIRLIEANQQTFSTLGSESILFRREFYTKFVNLNTLSAKNLLDCRTMKARGMLFDDLEEGRYYTFEEIKTLHDIPVQYIRLYNKLSIPRVDGRLIVIRQLIKHRLLSVVSEADHIDRLAVKLSQKPLSAWREQEFAHIEGLKAQDAVDLLIHHAETTHLVPYMQTRTDAMLVLRCWSNAPQYSTIKQLKEEIVSIDGEWQALIRHMGFGEQFLRNNSERVIEFLCRNGANITKTYYDGLSSPGQRESLKRIVKAELMGEFHSLKYYGDDLRMEIDFPIQKAQQVAWAKNLELTKDHITVRECDDFISTMVMGTMPQRTCLSYIDGQYNECLLSAFDSNKKILYAYVDGKVVGRAIIRLTKGRFSNSVTADKQSATLSFVDLENIKNASVPLDNSVEKERLTIFLERYYTAGLSPDMEVKVVNQFIELMERKATEMGVMLVLSNSYGSTNRPEYTRTYFYLYISKSKAGAQYLDSLNGSASVSDEGSYRSSNFVIYRCPVRDVRRSV